MGMFLLSPPPPAPSGSLPYDFGILRCLAFCFQADMKCIILITMLGAGDIDKQANQNFQISRSARSRRSETVEVRRDRSPIRVVRPPERVERVVVEESRETRRDRSRSRGESDEVVVIEEHSPPRRSKSKREKEERRESGYRTVDPLAYGGVIGGRKDRRGSGR